MAAGARCDRCDLRALEEEEGRCMWSCMAEDSSSRQESGPEKVYLRAMPGLERGNPYCKKM